MINKGPPWNDSKLRRSRALLFYMIYIKQIKSYKFKYKFIICKKSKGSVSMAKKPSLGYQFWQALQSKKSIGESRHIAKIRARELGGIYRYKTYDAYK